MGLSRGDVVVSARQGDIPGRASMGLPKANASGFQVRPSGGLKLRILNGGGILSHSGISERKSIQIGKEQSRSRQRDARSN